MPCEVVAVALIIQCCVAGVDGARGVDTERPMLISIKSHPKVALRNIRYSARWTLWLMLRW